MADAYSIGTYGSKAPVIAKLKDITGDGNSLSLKSVKAMSNQDLSDLLVVAAAENDTAFFAKLGGILDRQDMGGKKAKILSYLSNPESPKQAIHKQVLSMLEIHAGIKPEVYAMPRETSDSSSSQSEDSKVPSNSESATLGIKKENNIKHQYVVGSTNEGVRAGMNALGKYDSDKFTFDVNFIGTATPGAAEGKKIQLIPQQVEGGYVLMKEGNDFGNFWKLIVQGGLTNADTQAKRELYTQGTKNYLDHPLRTSLDSDPRASAGVKSVIKGDKMASSVGIRGTYSPDMGTGVEGYGEIEGGLFKLGKVGDTEIYLSGFTSAGGTKATQKISGANVDIEKLGGLVGAALHFNVNGKQCVVLVSKAFMQGEYFGQQDTDPAFDTSLKSNLKGLGFEITFKPGALTSNKWIQKLSLTLFGEMYGKKIEFSKDVKQATQNLPSKVEDIDGSGNIWGARVDYQALPDLKVFLRGSSIYSDMKNVNQPIKQQPTVNESRFEMGVEHEFGLGENKN